MSGQVVKLALGSVATLAGRLWSAQLAVAQNPWQGKTEVLAGFVPGLLSRSLGRLYAHQVDAAMRAYIAACTSLAQACRGDSRPSSPLGNPRASRYEELLKVRILRIIVPEVLELFDFFWVGLARVGLFRLFRIVLSCSVCFFLLGAIFCLVKFSLV